MKYSFLLCGFVMLAACSTSPEPEYYTLSSVPGLPQPAGKTFTVKVRRPVIPPTLDRPEMVSQSGDFRIEEHDNHLWSEPLDTMIERILAEDLRTRLPHAMVVTESSDVPVKVTYIVDIEIQQFATDAGGNAVLQAQAVIRKPDGKTVSLPVMLHGAHVTSGETMAKALSTLLGILSDNTTDSILHH